MKNTLTKEDLITFKNEMKNFIEEKLQAVQKDYKKIAITLDKIIELHLETKT